jgi:hydrogenase maturation protease
VLVAGVGNIFLGDDGFGVETVARLRGHPLPPGVELDDTGVRGVHLAYRLLDGYDTLIVVDAAARGAAPGTLHLIEPAAPGAGRDEPPAPPLDGHHMGPDAVLALLGTLAESTGGTPPRRVLVVGCEPGSLEEGIGLTPAVAAAVDDAVALVLRLLREHPDRPDRPAGPRPEPVPAAPAPAGAAGANHPPAIRRPPPTDPTRRAPACERS